MIQAHLVSESPERTEQVGENLAALVRPGDLVLLEGDLAAGKTTLVRGLVRGLRGDATEVSSPTFILVQTYPCCAGPVRRLHHVDLYRLFEGSREILREVGVEELLSDPAAVVAVEWPRQVLLDWLPTDGRVWRVQIHLTADGRRTLTVEELA